LNPVLGDIATNRRIIEEAVDVASEHGARWILTPELCVTGYFFPEKIGSDWIEKQPDSWMKHMLKKTGEKKLVLFLSYPEKDEESGNLHNSLFVLGPDGKISGKHRKIDVHPGPEEGWSTPGNEVRAVKVDGVMVGLPICADIYEPERAIEFKEKGAELLICPAAWGHKYGPGDRWEKRTEETGIPLWVCNRTGREKQVDWTKAESIVAKDGKRLLQKAVKRSSILLFDWDMETMSLLSKDFKVIELLN